MIDTVIALLSAWLADPTTGVNAQLGGIPRDEGYGPLPPVTVVDELTTGWVARGVPPEDVARRGPLLAVYQIGDVEMPGEAVATYRVAEVEIGVKLIVAASLSEAGTRQVHQTLRAVQRSMRGWLRDASREDREARDVYVEIAESWRQTPVLDTEDDALSTATITLSLTVRDLAPDPE